MICGLRESVCFVCSNGSVLGQQNLFREIYRFKSLLVYFQSPELSRASMIKEKGFNTLVRNVHSLVTTCLKINCVRVLQ